MIPYQNKKWLAGPLSRVRVDDPKSKVELPIFFYLIIIKIVIKIITLITPVYVL